MNYMEKLKSLLTPDQFKKVQDDLGEKTLFVNDGKNYISIEKFNTKNDELAAATNQISELKKTITDTEKKLNEFKTLETTNTELKTKITELTTSNAKLVEDSDKKLKEANEANEKKLNQTIIDSKIDVGLIALGATSEASKKSVKANLDFDKIVHKGDGVVEGLDDQLKTLHEASPALFFGDKKKDEQEEKKKAVGTNYFKGSKTEGVDLNKAPEDRIQTMYKSEGE